MNEKSDAAEGSAAPTGYPTLEQGTREEHIATLRRARTAGVKTVWSGDVRRNPYLRENLKFAETERMVRLTPYEAEQETGWRLTWLDHPELAG